MFALAGAGIYSCWVIEQQRPEIWLERMTLKPSGEWLDVKPEDTTGVMSVTEPWPITIDLPWGGAPG